MVVKDPIHVYKGHTEAKGTTQVKGLWKRRDLRK